MKIKLYRSSTIGVHYKNYSILFDPWLTDDEYYGSWAHIPPFNIQNNLNELNSYNAIYISHIHPDHCSTTTLKYLNKKIPIFIHKFKSPFIKTKIEKLGFKVIELDHGKNYSLHNNILLKIYAADNCDPNICYKFTGCADLKSSNTNQIDTFCYLEDENFKIINLNDCPFGLVKNFIDSTNINQKRIDLLLAGYSGAGPYPQCLGNLTFQEKINEAKKKKYFFLDQCFNYIKILNPRYYLPFAGTYYLTGKFSNINDVRGVSNIDEAYEYLEYRCKKENIDSKSLKINYEKEFDFHNLNNNSYCRQDNKKIKEYIKNNLSKKKYTYEVQDTNFSQIEVINLAKKAYLRMFDKMLINNFTTNTRLLIEYMDIFIILNLEKKEFRTTSVKNFKFEKPYLLIKLDPNLFYNLLKGPRYAHWNNAEIGSHLLFFRKPNVYERGLHASLSYFHC